jgi:serine protease Do
VARADEENSGRLRRSKRHSGGDGLSPEELDALLRRFFSGTSGSPISSSGSGFIIDPAGFIVTEDHVIENAEKVTVTLQDAKPYLARIIGRDPKTDLALLKIDVDHPLPYVEWADSDTVRVGDWVVTIGNPFGLDASVSSGIISGRGRDIHLGLYDDFLQIDAAINRGNSGGPTFDLSGRVIGINTAILSPNTGSVGIGFAIPANLAQPVIAQLRTRGKVERGWLGAHIQELTPELAQFFALPKIEGGLVADLTVNGPAARAGFARGDVILEVNGRKLSKKRDLLLAVAALPIGQAAEVGVWREGAEIVLRPVIREMPTGSSQIPATSQRQSQAQTRDLIIGLNLVPLTKARRELLEIPFPGAGHRTRRRNREHQPAAGDVARGGYGQAPRSPRKCEEKCADVILPQWHEPLCGSVTRKEAERAERKLSVWREYGVPPFIRIRGLKNLAVRPRGPKASPFH